MCVKLESMHFMLLIIILTHLAHCDVYFMKAFTENVNRSSHEETYRNEIDFHTNINKGLSHSAASKSSQFNSVELNNSNKNVSHAAAAQSFGESILHNSKPVVMSLNSEMQPQGICQLYTGSTCERFLKNQTVFIPPHLTLDALEDTLKAAYYGVIKESRDMNPNCRGYALPSLCYSVLPICRTPEKTNHQYFRNKAIEMEKMRLEQIEQITTTATTTLATTTTESTTISTTSTTVTSKTTLVTATASSEKPRSKKSQKSRDKKNKKNGNVQVQHHLTSSLPPPPLDELVSGTAKSIENDDLIAEWEQSNRKRSRRFYNGKHNYVEKRNSITLPENVHRQYIPIGEAQPLSLSKSNQFEYIYPPTRSSENLRRICRNECELLENELCQKEYAIAKRHPAIGQILPLEDCHNLPEESDDCSSLGIAIDVDENEHCYWENGAKYRGTIAVSESGKPCLTWARLMKEISDFPELAGQNYCRNPGGRQTSPWCYVDILINQSAEKVIELCDIPKCSDKMWLYVIAPFVSFVVIIITIITICCCRKFRKSSSRDGITNIQNINVSNAGKNIYGNSRLNSPIEMASLLVTQNQQESMNGNNNTESNTNLSFTQSQRSSCRLHNKQTIKQQQYSCHKSSFSLDATSTHNGNSAGNGCNMINNARNINCNDDNTSVCNIPHSGRNGNRSTALRVRQYMLHHVKFVEELGEGAFGKVYKGELTQSNGEKIFVAVKALKENASAKTQADFRREIELISDLKHDNIVCILGVVLKEEPLCMLFEYMAQGDLHEYLIANAPNETNNMCTVSSSASSCSTSLSKLQFLHIALQICEGMEYLASHHYVHRDLAARNCLVGEEMTVKISDFGLSRDIYSSDYYRVQSKSLLPVRWMPSESILYGKFTTESDVWSFGVVLWEIYSYGLQPYYGYSNQEVINMVRARQLLPCPEACPTAVYSLMVECWHEQAVRRPSFPEIGHRLKIWYQTQKRSELSDTASNGTSRKGSTFSVSTVRMNSITPSSSNHHIVTNSNADSLTDLNRSFERDGSQKHLNSTISSTHSSHSSHSHRIHQTQSDNQHPRSKHKSHHHSLDRDSNSKMYPDISSRQFYNTNPKPQSNCKHHQITRQSTSLKNVVKSRSNQSNSSISKIEDPLGLNNSDDCLNGDRMSLSSHCSADTIMHKNLNTVTGTGSGKPPKQCCKHH